MKKTAVLSAVALAIGLGSATSGFAADNRIGVTIYKYDDNFMSLMRKEIDKEAKALGGIELLMNDSQNAQSIQNDQVDGLLSKGVALAINLVDPAAVSTVIKKAKQDDIPVVFFNKDPGAKAIGSYDHAYYVGTDPKESGLIQGDLIAKQWKVQVKWNSGSINQACSSMLSTQRYAMKMSKFRGVLEMMQDCTHIRELERFSYIVDLG